jgi:hypothetical protein
LPIQPLCEPAGVVPAVKRQVLKAQPGAQNAGQQPLREFQLGPSETSTHSDRSLCILNCTLSCGQMAPILPPSSCIN